MWQPSLGTRWFPFGAHFCRDLFLGLIYLRMSLNGPRPFVSSICRNKIQLLVVRRNKRISTTQFCLIYLKKNVCTEGTAGTEERFGGGGGWRDRMLCAHTWRMRNMCLLCLCPVNSPPGSGRPTSQRNYCCTTHHHDIISRGYPKIPPSTKCAPKRRVPRVCMCIPFTAKVSPIVRYNRLSYEYVSLSAKAARIV